MAQKFRGRTTITGALTAAGSTEFASSSMILEVTL